MLIGEFNGSGKGSIIAGRDEALKREQIRKSAEAAFIEAFQKLQYAFIERINGL